MNTQKMVGFLYAKNEAAERKTKYADPSPSVPPLAGALSQINSSEFSRKKNWENNPTYSCTTKNEIPRSKLKRRKSCTSKTISKKGIEDDWNKHKGIPCLWILRTNIVEMSILPKGIYRFNAIAIKSPICILIDSAKGFFFSIASTVLCHLLCFWS